MFNDYIILLFSNYICNLTLEKRKWYANIEYSSYDNGTYSSKWFILTDFVLIMLKYLIKISILN